MAYEHSQILFAKTVPGNRAGYLKETTSVLNGLPKEISPLAVKSRQYAFPILDIKRDVSLINEEAGVLNADYVYDIAKGAILDHELGLHNLVYFELGNFEEPPLINGTFVASNKRISGITKVPYLFFFSRDEIKSVENSHFVLSAMLLDNEETMPALRKNMVDSMAKLGYSEHKI